MISDGQILTSSELINQRIVEAVDHCFRNKVRKETWVVLGENAVSAPVLTLYFSDEFCEGSGIVVGLIRSPARDTWDEDGPRLMQAFGLTKREAQLGLHLSRGQDLSEFAAGNYLTINTVKTCLLYTSPSPRDQRGARMPSSA